MKRVHILRLGRSNIGLNRINFTNSNLWNGYDLIGRISFFRIECVDSNSTGHKYILYIVYK